METDNNNGFLYFAVGALLVAIFALGFFFYNGQNVGGDDLTITERLVDTEPDAGPDFNLEIDNDGLRANGDTE